MNISFDILSKRKQEAINEVTEKWLRKRLFYTGIRPDPYFRGVGEFGASASTLISDEAAQTLKESYAARLKALPNNKIEDDMPTISE